MMLNSCYFIMLSYQSGRMGRAATSLFVGSNPTLSSAVRLVHGFLFPLSFEGGFFCVI